MPVFWNNVPAEFQPAPQFVLWKREERDGKSTKVPYQPNGRKALPSEPATWHKFEVVKSACDREPERWDGIGFVLSVHDPFSGVDLDHCIDPETGEIAEWAKPVIASLNSYSEISPSGTGVRIFLRGKLPPEETKSGRKLTGLGADGSGAIEVYDRLRYLTITGRHLAGTPLTIEPKQDEFSALYREWFQAPEPIAAPLNGSGPPVDLGDDALLERMFKSQHGSAIFALWRGRLDAHADDHSAADLALCNHLAWWTNGDRDRMDRLFRQSGLYREKWEREDYRDWTLDLALQGTGEGYSPAQPFEVDDPASQNGHKPPLTDAQETELETARALVSTLAERLKADAGAVYAKEMLTALSWVRAWDQATYERARRVLKDARIPIRPVEKELRPIHEFRPAIENGQVQGSRAGDMVSDCPTPALLVPTPYYLDEDATGRETHDDQGKLRRVVFAEAPVLIAGLTRDVTHGTESLLLRWRTRFGWQSRVVDRVQAATGSGLVKMASFGLPVGEDNTRDLIPYLRRLLHANQDLPCAKVSSNLGWQGTPGEAAFLCGSQLILPNGSIEQVSALDTDHPELWSEQRICFQGSGEGQDRIVAGFHSSGTFEAWLQGVALLRGYPKALAMFYAGLAAPLLPIFEIKNFVVELSHDTTSGKTSILRATASHWGSPDESAAHSVINTWNASRTGLERNSEILHSLPLFVDDTKNARDKVQVAQQVYEVCSGRGRLRGTIKGIAETAVWRTIMFSTGEEPITSFTTAGGTRTRVLLISGFPFGDQNASLASLTKKLSETVCRNYGHSGPRFLAWLQQNRNSWGEWREFHEKLTQRLTDEAPNPEAGRMAAYAALVSMAGLMAHRALPLPWKFEDPIAVLWKQLAKEAEDAAGSGRALADVLSWASSEEQRFIGRHQRTDFTERVPPAVYGRWDASEDWPFLAVYPTVLREVLIRFGYSPEGIFRSWRERGWLRHRDGKFTHDVALGHGTETRKMIVLLREAFQATGEG